MASYFHHPAAAVRFSPEKMAKTNLYESPRLFCDVYCLEPGQSQKEHSHAGNDKIYYCLTGTCTVRVGDQSRDLTTGELAIAPAGLVHGARNDSAGRATLLVIMAPHPDFHKEKVKSQK